MSGAQVSANPLMNGDRAAACSWPGEASILAASAGAAGMLEVSAGFGFGLVHLLSARCADRTAGVYAGRWFSFGRKFSQIQQGVTRCQSSSFRAHPGVYRVKKLYQLRVGVAGVGDVVGILG